VTTATPQRPASSGGSPDRLLPLIAAERTLRCIVLVAVGLVLVTHPHTDWAHSFTTATRDLGLNPTANGIQKLIAKIHAISPTRYTFFGVVAVAYGALEGCEAYGLWRRRPWGELLTVIATAVLFIPEIWEIASKATVLKVGALLVNIAVVIYLVSRLQRARRQT
jgi:uncharacterized membrane protein (DUF2068 family)